MRHVLHDAHLGDVLQRHLNGRYGGQSDDVVLELGLGKHHL
eukprot:CAMPEP_0181527912 /NCGR_PEP_ID=MMETSP1110-20121109/70253_1 /TAXON_ID=174948 /ORGANISM="Symbiodinium sp., Strain CCMP421" /LENGTH=40 /DNA_ID= /DNA_START= /DNA_END= /DNA_ORIENTATION=